MGPANKQSENSQADQQASGPADQLINAALGRARPGTRRDTNYA